MFIRPTRKLGQVLAPDPWLDSFPHLPASAWDLTCVLLPPNIQSFGGQRSFSVPVSAFLGRTSELVIWE